MINFFKKNKIVFVFICFIALIVSSCNDSSSKQNIKIKRYEKAIFQIEKNNIKADLQKIYSDFRFFLGDDYLDTLNLIRISNFISSKDIIDIYEKTQEIYPDIAYLEKDFSDAFALTKKYFPNFVIPEVYTYVSGLDIENPIYYRENALAIGLDNYLGSGDKIYLEAGIPMYKTQNFTKEHIVPHSLKLISDEFITIPQNNPSLLDLMIATGKQLYFLDLVLPKVNSWIKIDYTNKQWDWAEANEKNIWSLLIDQQILFSSERSVIIKFMSDAPFTSGLGDEAPSRLGVYIGWKIVNDYMKKNKNISVADLMSNTDSQSILKNSGYKPR